MGGRMISNVLHFLLRLTSRARSIYYRSLGVNIEGNGRLYSISIPRNWADITLEHNRLRSACARDASAPNTHAGPAP